MKTTRIAAGASTAALLAAAGLTIAVVGGSGSAGAATGSASATGLTLRIGHHVLVDKPAVTWTGGSEVSDAALDLDTHGVYAGVLNVAAGSGTASASLTDVSVGSDLFSGLERLQRIFTQLHPVCGALARVDATAVERKATGLHGLLDTDLLETVLNPKGAHPTDVLDLGKVTSIDLSQLTADDLYGTCAVETADTPLFGFSTLKTECVDGAGTVKIADLTIAGTYHDIDVDDPNTGLGIPGLLTLEVNHQRANPDGSLTVDGLYVNVADEVELAVSTATCGARAAAPPAPPAPAGTPPPAPVPTSAVTTHAPVTG
ncbi:hypothetical protein E8D34_14000 [Nocardioides sp. GY 10113]|uniref:hypothetical protein n=1 Tax=Nocardioides sp. GY 10113 TaxID=2569761 RepID=UPI0010A85E56|nr:hypothetical protein [Nocardioides sp. GY 10113]TIC84824.1 hypothetical protein E8D34_14000 [Nocardioides sp. GY 10113]